MAAAGKRALLVVDEAQNLTPRAVEELRMLSNFQLEDHALLQSFLVGQPEFRAIMQSPQMLQLRQRVIASFHLGPLDAAETQAYIEHRLNCVGWRGIPSFDAEALTAIHASSQGIPRRINAVCDRVLLAAFLTEQRRITQAIVDQVVAEMREEQVAPPVVQTDAPAVAAGLAGLDLARLAAAPDALRALAQAGEGFDTARFEERLALLERTLSTTLNALGQLLQAARTPPQADDRETEPR